MAVAEKTIEKMDENNMKALGIIKHALFALINGGDQDELDMIYTLEAVRDYLADNNKIFSAES